MRDFCFFSSNLNVTSTGKVSTTCVFTLLLQRAIQTELSIAIRQTVIGMFLNRFYQHSMKKKFGHYFTLLHNSVLKFGENYLMFD